MRAVGNVGNGALSSNMGADAIRVVGFVSDYNRARLEPIEQGLGVVEVMGFAGGNQQADRATFGVDPRMDFRGEATPASAHATISTLFFAPEAC